MYTDHQPLTKIFNETNYIPPLAAQRIQRWALLLSGYNYNIKYKCSKDNANADGLSRLPVGAAEVAHADEVIEINSLSDTLPITSDVIKKSTLRDPILSKVLVSRSF